MIQKREKTKTKTKKERKANQSYTSKYLTNKFAFDKLHETDTDKMKTTGTERHISICVSKLDNKVFDITCEPCRSAK